MASVLRWVQRRDVQEALELAASSNGHDVAADSIEGIMETEERERSGIFSTAANILAAYRLPAALQSASEPNFDPDAFVRSSDTVYICFPASEQEQLAPLVVAFLETVRRATYSREPGWPPVSFVLDEVANIAPLPGLPALVSEGGSQGLVTLACLQDLSQARARWGAAAEGFLTLFGVKLVLPGIADLRTLQLVSALAGDHNVAMQSVTRTGNAAMVLLGGTASTSSTTYYQRQAVWPVDHVARIAHGTALAMWPATAPVQIGLVPMWQEPWRAVIERAGATALQN
jgi:type IV secretory pathway TraG/TraD family ATPase VirD4